MNKCPSAESGQAGKADSCKGCPNASKCASAKPDPDIPIIMDNLRPVRLTVAVLSGKGGVGKSTIACNIAECLAARGVSTLILDFDLSGPSVPRLTNTVEETIFSTDDRLLPLRVRENLYAISVGHLEALEEKTRVFNTSAKNFTIKRILKMADFSNIDVMIVDTPPNIVDEHLALSNYIKPLSGIIVSTPQKLAFNDVVRQISFCRKIGMNIIGIVENMKHFVCSTCSHSNRLYSDSHIEHFCDREDIGYLGHLGLEMEIARDSDSGIPIANSLFESISDKIQELLS